MHIVLGILAAIVTILILLKRLADAGIALGGLNPFAVRTRTVTKTVDPPIYRLHSPLEAAGVLLVGTAKAGGDMTVDEKESLLRLFREQLSLSEEEATSLLRSSVDLFGDGVAVLENLEEVLKPVIGKFTEEQKESLIHMMEEVAYLNGNPHASKLALVASTKTQFNVHRASRASPWGT